MPACTTSQARTKPIPLNGHLESLTPLSWCCDDRLNPLYAPPPIEVYPQQKVSVNVWNAAKGIRELRQAAMEAACFTTAEPSNDTGSPSGTRAW